MRISEVMNKAFVIDAGISVKEAAKIMSNKNIGSLIIMNGEKITGIVTERDITKNVSSLGKDVSSIMSKGVVTISKNDNLDDASELMAEKKIKRLPVVDKGKLVGIVTVTDVIAHSDDLNEEFFFD